MTKTLYQVKYSFMGSTYKVHSAYPTEKMAQKVKAKIEEKPQYKAKVEAIRVLDYDE